MKPLSQRFSGTLYRKGEVVALCLDEAGKAIFLRYGMVLQGVETHVFPSVLLDDWGREKTKLALYKWVYEEGQRYPRAEVFGFTALGEETQFFLRDVEIHWRWPCYAVSSRRDSIPAGTLIHTIITPNPTHTGEPQESKRPAGLPWPLRRADVQWWEANPATLTDFGYSIYAP